MNVQDELRSLSRISENFRKKKGPKSKWPAEFQLRVLRLIDFGFSPTALARKLKIPVQTYYHWRRVCKERPKLGPSFIEVPVSDKLKGPLTPKSSVGHTESISSSMVLVFPSGVRVENVIEEFCLRALKNAV
jgi:transposase-like protein